MQFRRAGVILRKGPEALLVCVSLRRIGAGIRSMPTRAQSKNGLGESATYWVDAYAENPWVEGEAQEVGSLKAMAMAQGTVQVIGSGPVAYLEVGSH
eukprot:CAMPEP_0195026310 /NCGR_PEP_ID=MMETSP0326_2-20130528/49954_1 /TAXON_ID=2866 ORGANISM="Crypthecodinium cohnii, Strain Seligo" /NCGR_SAMPLE_ID=MMETSP0326_2 /ASSEMBLY_ACC=CAM_ASM_000348 /LENGTH=96 /DNA_ID=CAMNT_0040048097 /DNA_START=35 /DNA_END=323 /DNA_ORIENTATION=+